MTSPSDVTIAVPEPAAGHTLPPGTRLRDYRIERVLGEGGFGVVYLALDEALERHVAIKEYLPSSMASRASASFTVVVKSAQHRETFEHGKRSFLNEAKLLARFDHPALVKVHQYWEEHGTAYMVMPYYQGPTLKRVLAERGRPCTEADVRPWLMPLLDTLAVLHAERCYHRDVAPDNVLITARGPLLLDFGAARRVIGDLTHELTAVLKPGFAPIEQYGDVPGMSQGPWTDIYALASVLYLALAGRRPLTSVERLMDDQQPPLARVAAGRGSPAFLGAVDAALALRPKDRPQSVEDFRRLLDADLAGLRAGGPPVAPASVPLPAAAPVPAAVVPPPAAAAPAPARPRPAAPVDLPETLPPRTTPALAPAPDPSTAPAEGPRNRAPLWAAGAALAVLATGGAWLASTRDGGAGGPAPVTAASAAAPVVASAPALPVPTAVAAEPPASEPAPAPAPTPAAAPAPASTATSPPAVAAAASEPDSPPSRPATASRAAPPAPQRQAARPARPAPAAEEAPAPAVTAPAPRPARPAPAESESTKCSDILQKASLEPLSAEETAYLKRECRR